MKMIGMILLLSGYLSAWGWTASPHLLIAEIAYAQLDDEVRAKADHLIAVHAKQYPDTADFVSAALWADLLRIKDEDHTYDHWHYISLTFKHSSDPIGTAKAPHVAWAINHELAILRQPSTSQNQDEQGLALRRLIHWVGDSHQPMHATTRISAAHPRGDRGGNDFILSRKASAPNLHALWDEAMGIKHGKALARALVARYPQTVGTLDPQRWVLESHAIGREYAYPGIAEGGLPSSVYLLRAKTLAEQRIVLAGFRLAAVLNEALGSHPYDIIKNNES